MTLDDIQESLAGLQDKQLDKFQKEVEKALVRLQSLVDVNLAEDLSNPLEYDFKMQQYLNESGYYKAVNNLIDDGFDVVYSNISDAFTAGGIAITYTQDDLVKLNALKQLTFDKYNALANETITTLKADIYKYSLSNYTKNDIASSIRQSLQNSGLARYSNTYALTSISDYTQGVIDYKSNQADKGVWIYKGVLDSKTRPFCRHTLEEHRAYNDVEKQKIQSNPLRRWNCRHILLKVSEEYAIEKGYMKGKVEEQKSKAPKIRFGYDGKFDKYVEDIRDEAK
ncbi:MAG: hypothetical protein ACO295_08325, partial [Sediminibacterium sp.]